MPDTPSETVYWSQDHYPVQMSNRTISPGGYNQMTIAIDGSHNCKVVYNI